MTRAEEEAIVPTTEAKAILPEPIAGEWLTVSQAARRIERAPQTVRDLIAAGRLRATMTPLGRLIEAASCDELLARRAATSAAK